MMLNKSASAFIEEQHSISYLTIPPELMLNTTSNAAICNNLIKMSSDQVNVLIADDDNDDRFFFAKALQEIPVKSILSSVINGEELMDHLSANADNLPDILFLDLSMPRKTGFECLIEIRANKKFENLFIVMLSTSFMRGVDYEQNLVDTLIRMGAQQYIRKPSDFDAFKTIIYQTLTELAGKTV